MEDLAERELSQFESGQVLNIHKPSGITSFDVVKKVRQWTKCKKVGHAGTLDPLATGVLLVCTGKATKSVSKLTELEKEYLGTIELGKRTETDDSEGKIIYQKPVPSFTKDEIYSALQQFKGNIKQVPPMFSALKHHGKRLYELARKGKTVNREPRNVMIYNITLLEWENPCMRIVVRCSRGTYIRALARDVGEYLKTGGYLKKLCRTRIGPYKIDDAILLEQFERQVIAERENISIH